MKLFYWNESNAEVDFVLQWNNQYIGLEVKIAKDKVSGLARFSQQFKPHKIYQLNDDGLSWQRLLEMDPRTLF